VTPEEDQNFESWRRGIGRMLGFDATRKENESIDDFRERMRGQIEDTEFRLKLENR